MSKRMATNELRVCQAGMQPQPQLPEQSRGFGIIRSFLFLPLLFFTMGVSAEKLPAPQSLPPFTSIIITNNGYFADFFRTFERESDCIDFTLSTVEIRKFFIKARLVPQQKTKSDTVREASRCQVWGRAKLQDGRSYYFRIDRTGYGDVRFVDERDVPTSSGDYFCDTCGDKFYPAMNKKISDFRPILKSFAIEGNPIDVGANSQTEKNRCEDFSLSEEDVGEFFKKMQPISRFDYMHLFDYSPCLVEGRMVFQDGRKGSWSIDSVGKGVINIENKEEFYSFCADCNPKKFGEPCDLECHINP